MGLASRLVMYGVLGILVAGFSSRVFAGTAPTPSAEAPQVIAMLYEIESIKFPDFDRSKREDPHYVQTYAAKYQAALKKRKELASAFADKFPENQATPGLLLFVAQVSSDNPEKQIQIYRRIEKNYPGSSAARAAAGPLRQIDAVGKPFKLSFTDAISGKKISMADLKGKVVVIDFWATWCGPCVGEMPENKKIYEECKDKGVEFIGVSLDNPESQGGLDRLKKFVATNGIAWPQYYQGNGWNSEFSASWGINSIPTVFIVDTDGNLYSTEARGNLKTLIPKLLAGRAAKPGA